MKILIAADVPCNPNSGAAGTVYHVSEALRALGHDVENIWDSDLPHKIKHGNLHYLLELPGAYVNEIKKRVRGRGGYDVIQISQPYCYLAAKYIKNHFPGTICVHKSHGLELNADRHVKPFIKKESADNRSVPRKVVSRLVDTLLARHSYQAAKYCDGTLVPSHGDEQLWREEFKVPEERVFCVFHGVPDVFLRTDSKSYDERRHKKILYVGQYAFVKGPHILARVMNQVLSKRDDVTMTWVCDEEHHHRVLELLHPEIATRVHLLPWVAQEELIKIYDDHGIFLFPSLYEGFGKVFLEAMSRGLCTITTNVGAMADIIHDGENGFLVAPGAEESLAAMTLKALDDFERAKSISQKSIETARKYTWKRTGKESVDFYKRLLKLKRG